MRVVHSDMKDLWGES